MRFVKPLDGDAVLKAAEEHNAIITLEDGCIMGGAGSAVLEHLQQNGVLKVVKMLGLPDSFILQGTQQEMYKEHGLDAEGIIKAADALTS
jgi:1-deoxy-D-xylulose-5-phosphate synthase